MQEKTRDRGLTPGSGRSPAVGNGNLLQYFCLKSSMDRGVWQATVHSKSQTWLSTHAHKHKHWKRSIIVCSKTLCPTSVLEIVRKWLLYSPSRQHFFWMPAPSPSLLPLQSMPTWLLFPPPHQNCFWQGNHLGFISAEGHLLSSLTGPASSIPHSKLFAPSEVLPFCFPSSHTPLTPHYWLPFLGLLCSFSFFHLTSKWLVASGLDLGPVPFLPKQSVPVP